TVHACGSIPPGSPPALWDPLPPVPPFLGFPPPFVSPPPAAATLRPFPFGREDSSSAAAFSSTPSLTLSAPIRKPLPPFPHRGASSGRRFSPPGGAATCNRACTSRTPTEH